MRRIGPDVQVLDWSEGGAVHVYVTRSGGSERAQMVQDLSVNVKEGGAAQILSICHTEPAILKNTVF